MITDEIFTSHGEPHFVWPHRFVDGNSPRCDGCRYYAPKTHWQGGEQVELRAGRCRSKARLSDRGQVAPGATFRDSMCRWWFPIGKIEGEQEELWTEGRSK